MHAYLMQVHEDPEFCAFLVETLAEPDTRFFLHVDRKSDIAPFRQALADRSDVAFVTERSDIRWGGWSQVQATLDLIATARRTGQPFRHYSLISGNHFPLIEPARIRSRYRETDREYINITAVPNPALDKKMDRFRCFYLEGAHRAQGFGPKLRAAAYKLISRVPLRRPEKLLPGRRLYAGSNWWTLSSEAVNLVMDTVAAEPDYVRFFRYVRCCDEAFFQTILGNSPLAERCARADVYTDWSDPREAPCYIRDHHLRLLLDPSFRLEDGYGIGPAHFSRKFGTRNRDVAQRIKDSYPARS